jgi:PAS domain S-box-containing protein
MEHGFCLNWERSLVALHVGSDIIIGISYYSIPLAMFYFAYRRRDLPFLKIFIMFALFILSCGTTHFLSAYTIFRPDYWIEGYVKALTASISAVTAIIFIPRIPDAIVLPSIINSLEENKKLIRELGAKNAELQLANLSIENVLDPVFWITADSRVMRANEAACKSLGYTNEEMLGLSIADLNPHYPLERWLEHWHDLKAHGSLRFETQHRAKDGRLMDVEVSANYISYEGHEYNCAIIRDVSARKQIERELRANEKRMASLYGISQHPYNDEHDFLDHALNEVIELTESKIGYIYLYNEKTSRFTLSSFCHDIRGERAEPEQKTIYELENTGLWGEAVRQKKPILINDFQANHPLKKGCPEEYADLVRFVTLPIIVDEEIVAVVGVADKEEEYTDTDVMQLKLFMDSVWMITMRKRAEDDRVKLEKQLLHAQKLESLGVLAGGIAHDFNNILMAIVGNADLALMKLVPESPAIGNLRDIERSAARAADLAKQMLAYSGKGKFIIEAIDLNRLLEEMLHMLKVSISKKAILRLIPAQNLPSVEADATQLRQVFMNLVINASEAIGELSGVIAINTGCMECDRIYLKDVWLDEGIPAGTYIYVEVSDTGCGMDSETMTKIFDPFFTTKFTGRGLGMAAVLGIVRGHKGSIKVYSELGKGTTFKLLFPASEQPAKQLGCDESIDVWRGSGTVLLVDDEEAVRATGGKMLREVGFEVITASDGREAIETFRKDGKDISFVILDLAMPHMDGEQCFRELRALAPGVRVIMSSGYNEHDVTQRFVGKGLCGFIQKPYKLSELKRVIMEMEK